MVTELVVGGHGDEGLVDGDWLVQRKVSYILDIVSNIVKNKKINKCGFSNMYS